MPDDLTCRRFRFGGFELDVRSRELSQAGTRVRLPDQSVQLLIALIERSGDVVTRGELRDRLWPADTFVDFEHGLNSAIRRLRGGLGESADAPAFVETLPRRGYRFIGTVEPVADAPAATAPSVGRAPFLRVPHPWLVVTAVLLVPMLALGAWVAGRGTHARTASGTAWSAPSRVTFDDGLQAEPSYAPDGQQMAYAGNAAGNFDIWALRVPGGRPVQVTNHPANDRQPDWSPDGTLLAFRSERGGGGIFVVPASGGVERQLTNFGFRPQWAPDSRKVLLAGSILTGGALDLHVIGVSESTPRHLSGLEGAFGWQPDGHHVFVLTSMAGPFIPIATSIDSETGVSYRWTVDAAVSRGFQERKLSVPGGEAVRWTSPGNAVYFVGDVQHARGVWRIDLDARSRRVIGGPHAVTTVPNANGFALTGSGDRLTFDVSSSAARLWTYALDESGAMREGTGDPVTPEAAHVESLDLSRDGSRLVFIAARPNSGQHRELVARDLSTGNERVIKVVDDDRGPILFPRWSHDGKHLSYTAVTRTSPDTAHQQVFVFDPAVGRERPLTSPTTVHTLEFPTGWTPDGRSIVSSGRRYLPGRCAIVLLALAEAPEAERHARVITSVDHGELTQASMSPDERWVVFRALDRPGTRRARLAVVDARGGAPAAWVTVVAEDLNGDKPRWSQTGDAIYFTSDDGAVVSVWRVSFDTNRGRTVGMPGRLTSFGGPTARILPDIRMLEIGLGGGRIVLPIVRTQGGLWTSERTGG